MSKIEHDIPAPRARMLMSIPFGAMQPGDSVFLKGATLTAVCAAHRRARERGLGVFTARKQQRGDVEGVRLWRVE